MRIGILFLVGLVFLSGCFSVEVIQVINSDGTAQTTTTIIMPPSNQQVCEGEECFINQENPCDQAPHGAECVYDEETGTATYVTYDVLQEPVFIRKRGLLTTRYTLTELSTVQELEEITSELSEEESVEVMNMLGLSATHIVVMPAPIIESSVGIISGNQVEIDLLNVQRNVRIVAEKENNAVIWAMALFVGSIFLIALVLGIQSVLRKRRKNAVLEHTPSEVKRGDVSPVSHTEKKYRDYILQYKNTHNRKDIKSALTAAGISGELAEKYLKRYYK